MAFMDGSYREGMVVRVATLWSDFRATQARRRALRDVLAKCDDHLIEDVAVTRELARHERERRHLHSIAEWTRWGGGGR